MLNEKSTTGSAVVIGAGTMGGGIAAQLANAGWQVWLLDVAGSTSKDAPARNEAAIAGLDRVVRARPPLLFLPEFATRIRVGNTDNDLECMRDADWIVEAVAERMDIKKAIMATIQAHAGPHTVVTSNTSGLGLTEMTEGRSAEFRARFLGSHFLNPPRYLKLLEVVPLPYTDPVVASGFVRFAEQVLGHRVVIAKDTAGFISTRIWIEHLAATMHIAVQHGLSVEEADALTGALLGRPRSATFRMADLVGLDIVSAIARNQYKALQDDPYRDILVLPPLVQQLIARGRLGDKAGAGFYKREGKAILALDLVGGEYRPREDPHFPEVESLQKRPLPERLAAIVADQTSRGGRFVNAVLDSLRNYVEYAGPLVAPDTLAVDNVMRWGFQWEMGPFEMEDLRSGTQRSYQGVGAERKVRAFGSPHLLPMPSTPEYLTLAQQKSADKTVFEAPEGALIDLGGGVVCLEFRTKMNTVSPPLCAVIDRARKLAERDFAGMVIGSDGPHFSAGYNLKLLLEAALSEDGAAIDEMLRGVQATLLGLKYSTIPIVAAIRGYTLGAGCECALQCAAIQAGPELIMGLPEIAAGLVPAGGGVKELLARAMAGWDGAADPFPRVERAFRQITLDGSSGSAAEARKLGLLRPTDAVSRNSDRLLYDAKQKALILAKSGYRAPERGTIQVLGENVVSRLRMRIDEQRQSGAFTEHDCLIADRIAFILSGGQKESGAGSEERLLTLEREALISLAHEPPSIERMKALLETGKPVRN